MMKKLFFDFCTQVMVAFAYIIILLTIFCVIFGSDAKNISSIFSLGSEGISVSTIFQFFMVSVLTVGIRTLFVSDFLISKMSYFLRNLCMLILIFIVITVCIILFSWFPIGKGSAWIMFFICYGLSFGLSLIVTAVKINIENKRLGDALEQLKKKDGKEEF